MVIGVDDSVWCTGICVIGRFMLDAADHDNLELATSELFALLEKHTMAGIPVLVLGNKSDLPAALDEQQLIDKMYVHSFIHLSIPAFHHYLLDNFVLKACTLLQLLLVQ